MSPVLSDGRPACGAELVSTTRLRLSGRCGPWLACAVIAGLVGAGVGELSAQQPREVLLGTVGASAPLQSPPRATTADSSHEAAAGWLIEEARRELAKGEIGAARLHLQNLLLRFPESTPAAEGRRVLGRLDQALSAARAPAWDGADTAESPGAHGRALVPLAPAPADSLGHDSRISSGARTSAWSTQNQRAQLDQEFRESTGDRIFFGNASTDLGARARQVLGAQAQWLRRHPDVSVTIEAHADDGGSTEFNLSLARKRGEAVRDRLVQEGVAGDRVRLANRGRDLKIASCSQTACTEQNRRVITIVEGRVAASESPSRMGQAAPPRN